VRRRTEARRAGEAGERVARNRTGLPCPKAPGAPLSGACQNPPALLPEAFLIRSARAGGLFTQPGSGRLPGSAVRVTEINARTACLLRHLE